MNKKKFIEVDLTIVNLEDEVVLTLSNNDRFTTNGSYGGGWVETE